MSYVTIEIEEELKRKKLFEFYNSFMSTENSKPESFNSMDDFKKSASYQALSDEEKINLKPYEGKKVIVLMFENEDQVIKFIEQAQENGLLSKEQAEKAISQFKDQNPAPNRLGM